MDHFAGLDVSVKETSVCIVDETGKIVREMKLASEPDALVAVLKKPSYHFKRIGLEAGPLSQWLFCALAEAGLPVICVETRHMRAVLKAQITKTDRRRSVAALHGSFLSERLQPCAGNQARHGAPTVGQYSDPADRGGTPGASRADAQRWTTCHGVLAGTRDRGSVPRRPTCWCRPA